MTKPDLVQWFSSANPITDDDAEAALTADQWQEMFEGIVSHEPPGRRKVTRTRRGWHRPTVTIPIFVVLSASALLFASAIAGDRTIPVNASEALADPDAVERYLAEEGIEATIKIVPAMDALAGKWFHLYLDPKADIDVETFALLESYVGVIDYRYDKVAQRCGPTAGECERTSILEIPGTVKGPITLVVGRPAEQGEAYWAEHMAWDNELAPSGALYCMHVEDRGPDDIERTLTAVGYQVHWTYDPRDTGPDGEESREVEQPPAGTAVTVAHIFKPGAVSLRVSPLEDVDRYRRMEGTPTAETGRPDYGDC